MLRTFAGTLFPEPFPGTLSKLLLGIWEHFAEILSSFLWNPLLGFILKLTIFDIPGLCVDIFLDYLSMRAPIMFKQKTQVPWSSLISITVTVGVGMLFQRTYWLVFDYALDCCIWGLLVVVFGI